MERKLTSYQKLPFITYCSPPGSPRCRPRLTGCCVPISQPIVIPSGQARRKSVSAGLPSWSGFGSFAEATVYSRDTMASGCSVYRIRLKPEIQRSATASKAHRRSFGRKRPGYDCQVARRFEFVSLRAIPVLLVYAMRRVNCPQCGVVVEPVPWASGKNQQTIFTNYGAAAWS